MIEHPIAELLNGVAAGDEPSMAQVSRLASSEPHRRELLDAVASVEDDPTKATAEAERLITPHSLDPEHPRALASRLPHT